MPAEATMKANLRSRMRRPSGYRPTHFSTIARSRACRKDKGHAAERRSRAAVLRIGDGPPAELVTQTAALGDPARRQRIVLLADIVRYMETIGDARQSRQAWRYGAQLLFDAVERDGTVTAVRKGARWS